MGVSCSGWRRIRSAFDIRVSLGMQVVVVILPGFQRQLSLGDRDEPMRGSVNHAAGLVDTLQESVLHRHSRWSEGQGRASTSYTHAAARGTLETTPVVLSTG